MKNASNLFYRIVCLFTRIITLSVIASCGGGSDSSLSNSKQITAFSFTSPAAIGTIDQSARTIAVSVPSGTDMTALIASYTTTGQSVTIGSTTQASSFTPNNFTSPVIYRVKAADGSYQDYTVKVTVLGAQWARIVDAENSDSIFRSVSEASDGSLYAAGEITGTGTFNFGNGVTASGTSTGLNIILVKYNSSGVAQWAQTVTVGSSDSFFCGVSVASDGSVYAAGFISGTGTYNFGNSVTATGTYTTGTNIVLVKYNSSGVAQWARTVDSGNYDSSFNGVSVGSDGSVYAAGFISGYCTFNFGNSVSATAFGYNIVLVKYSSSGVVQWARTVNAGNFESSINSVFVASDGSVYAAGYIAGTGTYDFGNNVTAAGTNTGYNIVLVKYNSSGMVQWARTADAGNGDSLFYGVSVASDGSVYAAGYIAGTGTYDFGSNATAKGAYSGKNIVLINYNSSGVVQWVRTADAGNGNSLFYGVSVASDGSVYAAGNFAGTGDHNFGSTVVASGTYTGRNIVLIKYNSSGVVQWARTADSGNGDSGFNSVSAASDGAVYVTGAITGTDAYNFGNNVTAAGAYTGWKSVLVKYY